MDVGQAERFKPHDVGLVRDHVYEQLLSAVIDGRLKPGERIRERALAEELGVSTTPIKEAIQRLHHAGLLRTEPRRGAFVSDAATTSIAEVTAIRAKLEGLAAGWAAEKIDEEQREELAASMADMVEHSGGEPQRLAEVNAGFHRLVRQISGNNFAQHFVELLLPFDASVRRRALSLPGEAERGHAEHVAIYEAVIAQDAERAATIAETHVLRTFEFVAQNMDLEPTSQVVG